MPQIFSTDLPDELNACLRRVFAVTTLASVHDGALELVLELGN